LAIISALLQQQMFVINCCGALPSLY